MMNVNPVRFGGAVVTTQNPGNLDNPGQVTISFYGNDYLPNQVQWNGRDLGPRMEATCKEFEDASQEDSANVEDFRVAAGMIIVAADTQSLISQEKGLSLFTKALQGSVQFEPTQTEDKRHRGYKMVLSA